MNMAHICIVICSLNIICWLQCMTAKSMTAKSMLNKN